MTQFHFFEVFSWLSSTNTAIKESRFFKIIPLLELGLVSILECISSPEISDIHLKMLKIRAYTLIKFTLKLQIAILDPLLSLEFY